MGKYMTRTVHVFLDVDDNTYQRINDTRDIYADIFNKHAQWATEHKSVNSSSAHNSLYESIRKEYPQLPSAMIQCARNHALGAVKSYNSNNPSKRWSKKIEYRSSSMNYDRRTVSLSSSGKLTFSLSGGKRGTSNINVPKFFTNRYGDWKFNSATIGIDRNGNAFANLSFRKIVVKKRDNGKVVGIDRGIYNIASTSNGELFSSKKIRGRKRQLRYNRAKLQSKVAQGSRSAKRRLQKQKGKEARFSLQQLHIITKKLSQDTAVSTYVIEDLSGLYSKRRSKNFNRLRSMWSPSIFEFQLTYKCEQHGIDVVKVDPRYTSQTCSNCGSVNKKNRNKSEFSCVSCGFSEHADINAACNIRDKYISTLPTNGGVVQGACQSPDDALPRD